MRAWSCITSYMYPLRGLLYLGYDNVNPAVVNSKVKVEMLRSSMLAFEKVYCPCETYSLKMSDKLLGK